MEIPDYLKSQIQELDQKIAQANAMLSDESLKSLAQEEISRLEDEKAQLLNSVSARPQDSSPDENGSDQDSRYDKRDLILEIRGAAGGEEAKLWGEDLLRMYTRFAQTKGWKVEPEGPLAIKIKGKNAFGILKFESGVHRVQRVPVTESSGRVHTSTATVAIIPELEDFDITISPADLQWDFFRSGGHGGQNVNKVSSAVRLTHLPTGHVVTSQEERDQPKNRDKALKKLRQILWEKEEEKRLSALSADRLAQVGTGMRNEKIRTYNFLQDRVTDHRLDANFHNIASLMEGNLDPLISALHQKFTPAP